MEAKLNFLIDDVKNKCSTAVEERDVVGAQLKCLEGELAKMSNLQKELANLTPTITNFTKQAEISEKKSIEATEVVERCFSEGKAEWKKEAEAEATTMFDTKCTQFIEEFKASLELINICTKDCHSAGQQIVDMIKQEHPEWELSFLYVHPPLTDDDNSSPPGDGDNSAAGSEA